MDAKIPFLSGSFAKANNISPSIADTVADRTGLAASSQEETLREEQERGRRREARSVKMKRRKRLKKYQLIPLCIAGVVIFLIVMFLGGIIWGSISYIRQIPVLSSVVIPLAIYLLAVFCSSFFVSLFVRAKTPIFALILSILLCLACWAVSGFEQEVLPGLLLKVAFSLIAAGLGYILARTLVKNNQRKNRQNRANHNHPSKVN